jgi:hypothetical protein
MVSKEEVVLPDAPHTTGKSLRTLSEATAVVSVLAGLLFVGVEIQNNTAAARAESRRAAATENIDFLMRIVEDPHLNDLWGPEWTLEFYEGLTPADKNRTILLAISLMLRLESVYLQFEEGLLDESAFGAYGLNQPQVRSPWFKSYWQSYRPNLDPDFVAYFEQLNGY